MTEFDRGYKFAMNSLIFNLKTAEELSGLTDAASDFGDVTQFDRGVDSAVMKWRELNGRL